MIFSADAARLPLADRSVDLVMGSPPYLEARTYGIGAGRKLVAWVDWMLAVTAEAVRVSRGLVLWVCAGSTRNWCYQPGPEGLLYEWVRRGGVAWRPAYWRRVGIPGSGGKQWLRADVEYVLAFAGARGSVPWADNTANGHPPKWAPGGECSHRLSDGARVNQWGHPIDSGDTVADVGGVVRSKGKRPSHKLAIKATTRRRNGTDQRERFRHDANGEVKGAHARDVITPGEEFMGYTPPVLANPGNLVDVKVGGNLMGHPLAHDNEAPYPVDLAKWFIRSHCPPGGTVLDPFAGSGTTAQAALELGRVPILCDLRLSQCRLSRRRLADVQPDLFA